LLDEQVKALSRSIALIRASNLPDGLKTAYEAIVRENSAALAAIE
jgi:hypothetical protein